MATITLRGRFLRTGGAPQVGAVTAVLAVDKLHNQQTGADTPRAVLGATLDAAGGFTLSVPSTNDPGQTPIAALNVTETFSGGGVNAGRSYSVVVPYDAPGGVVELLDLAPALDARLGYELVRFVDPALLGQLVYPGFVNGPETVTTTFPPDGTIVEAYSVSGVTATTTANADGSLTTVFGAPLGRTVTTTFAGDGSISEVVT